MPPRLQLTSVTLGCPNPRDLAAFYARLLDGQITACEPPLPEEPEESGWAQVRAYSDFGRITLNFEYERYWTPPVWPSEPGRQRITQHLDILIDDLEDALEWALACGATVALVQPQEDVCVLLDPAGHPFCLFT